MMSNTITVLRNLLKFNSNYHNDTDVVKVNHNG